MLTIIDTTNTACYLCTFSNTNIKSYTYKKKLIFKDIRKSYKKSKSVHIFKDIINFILVKLTVDYTETGLFHQ